MRAQLNVTLDPDDVFPFTPADAATQVLEALGGDPAVDGVTCVVLREPATGYAGSDVPSMPPGVVYVTLPYAFSTAIAPPPSARQLRVNGSLIYIDYATTNGDDVSAQLLALVVDDVVEIRGQVNPARYGRYALTSVPVDRSGYVELAVIQIESGPQLQNGACTLTIPEAA